MTASAYPKGLEPGIYFGLHEDIYHNDRAVSRGDIVKMIFTPNAYWQDSWMNPLRRRREKSEEMIYGSAFHTLLFEPHMFDKRFFQWGMVEGQPNRPMITESEVNAIKAAIRVLRAGKDSHLFLSKGYPEVTIVFDGDGIRYRTRHDYLGLIATTDFKTARTLEDGYLKKEFRDRGLDIQDALYLWSRIRFKEQFKAGEAHVYGEVDKDWFKRFMTSDTNDFILIFQHKTSPYPFKPLLPDEYTQDQGMKKILDMSRIYKQYMKDYGPHISWPVSEGKLKEFSMIYGTAD